VLVGPMAHTHLDRDTFLRLVRKSRLLTGRQLRQILPQLPPSQRGRSVARALVKLGHLTKFQAELLLVGRTQGFFLGQYRILDHVGQGGMGRVYKAMHQTMNRVVALKVLAPQLVKTERAQQLFQREVRAAAQLIHPNIVTAFDANQVGKRHYLVMEFIDGPNLEQLVREQGPLGIGLAAEIVRQVAAGLQHAYEMGMVHRDIKPANLLLQKSGKNSQPTFLVKILDFGLAHLYRGEDGDVHSADTLINKPNTVQGTPDFLSPEQAKALPNIDIRSDLYGLGCTFYYLLTGQVPFPGGTSLEKLYRHNSEAPRPVDQLRPDLPAELVDIVHCLLAKDRADRFQTPQELIDVLKPFAHSDMSWSKQNKPASAPDLPSLATPSGDLEAASVPEERDEAMEGTVPPEMAPTSTSTDRLSLPWADDDITRRQLRNTLLWSVCIVSFLLGALALLLLRQWF